MSFRSIVLAIIAAGLVMAAETPRAAHEPEDWAAIKCERYGNIWSQAMARLGSDGLGPAFLERHAAFLASGCTARADVCARSDREIAMANAMIVMAMNAGMASTFPPFYCSD